MLLFRIRWISVDPLELTRFHRNQSLGFKNGYALPKRPEVGIGGVAIPYNQLSEQELDELANYKPTLTYGQAKQAPPEDFIPAHVGWDKKVLKFNAWFKQTVHESPNEHYRVRHVNIYYYLEDDSISVVEPHVENSGMPQGKLIKRQRLPKNDVGDHWHWKDLNNGVNVVFYGKVFHIYDCDKWTQNFLESEGIEVAPCEDVPTDPYIESRNEASALRTYKTQSDFDKLRQFLEMDRKYFLVDDSIEVREIHGANSGHDPFPILIGRHRIPKDRYNVESTFSGVVMELSEQEIKQYFTPRDFNMGDCITIYNRRFFIYDMDNFTKAFYWKNFSVAEFQSVDVESRMRELAKMEIPPYNGFGSLEDSLQSCLSLIPQPPKKDFIKMLENDGKQLRYECVLDSAKNEDHGRRFILCYSLSDDMITIYEPPVRNSGIIGGKFLERTRVSKPSSTPDCPQFYGPRDFYIGAVIEIFKHRFRIVNADQYVLRFMEQHTDQFPEATMQSLRDNLGGSTGSRLASATRVPAQPKSYAAGELEELVREVKGQLKKIAITSSNRKDKVFLDIDMDRQGFISKANLQELCLKQHLPADAQIIDKLAAEINPSNPDHITLEDLRCFLESA